MKILHSIVFFWGKFRMFGIIGTLKYPLILWQRYRRRRFFIVNADNHKGDIPLRGITVIAPFFERISLSKVMRDFIFALDDAGIAFQALNFNGCKSDGMTMNDNVDMRLNRLLTDRADFNILKYSHVIGLYHLPISNGEFNLKCAKIAFWEFESGFPEVYPEVAHGGDPVIAMSDFNVSYFERCFRNTPVHKILYPFQKREIECLPSRIDIRKKYGIGENEFVVFFNFDYISTYGRKNPDGAVRAFAQAFKDFDDVRLVFKTMHADQKSDYVSRLWSLIDELGMRDRCKSIDHYLPENDVYGLTNACDVYLALHRGEGFGIPVAEAMFLGKPVVITGYSSVLEFCNADNSIIIPYEMVPVPSDFSESLFYRHVKEWAEPDIGVAADALQRLYSSPDLRRRLGDNAHSFIVDYFSTENFRRSVERFLDT